MKQGLLKIVLNVIILNKIDYKNAIFFSEKLRDLWLVLRQLWFFARIVVGVATVVVDCNDCEHCDNCDHITCLQPISQL